MSAGQQVFTSWKEIASYLGKSVRTVQRWEKELGLPVQRPNLKAKGTVRAYRADLDDWAGRTWFQRSSTQDAAALEREQLVVRESIAISRQLRVTHRAMVEKIKTSIHQLAESCRQLEKSRDPAQRWWTAKAASDGDGTK